MSTASASFTGNNVRTSAADERSLPTRALGNVLTIAAVFCVVVAGIVLFGFGGWEYYRAPLEPAAISRSISCCGLPAPSV